MPLVKRVDLYRFKAGGFRHCHELQHLRGSSWFHAHGTERYPPSDFVHCDLENSLLFGEGEGISLAAAASTYVDPETGIGYTGEVGPESALVKLKLRVEWRNTYAVA